MRAALPPSCKVEGHEEGAAQGSSGLWLPSFVLIHLVETHPFWHMVLLSFTHSFSCAHLSRASCVPGTLLSAHVMYSPQHVGTPHTHSHCVPSFSSSCFSLGKSHFGVFHLVIRGETKKRILMSSYLSWNSLCSDDPIYLFLGRSWLPLSRFILWMPKWGRFPAEAESIAGNLSCFPYWWWMAKFPESILDI